MAEKEILEKTAADLAKLRHKHGWMLVVITSVQAPLVTFMIYTGWGYGTLTFLNVCMTFYVAYGTWDSYKVYLRIKYEENRVRRALEGIGQNG